MQIAQHVSVQDAASLGLQSAACQTLVSARHNCFCCCLQEYKEYHTDTEVHFQLFFTAAKLQEVLSGAGPHQKLKLIGKASIGELPNGKRHFA